MKISILFLVFGCFCLAQGGFWTFNMNKEGGVKPLARSEASTVMISETTMLLFGGVQSLDGWMWNPLGDLWKYETETKEWTQMIQNNNSYNFQRTEQVAVFIPDRNQVVIYGGIRYIPGQTKFLQSLADMLIYDVATNQISQVAYQSAAPLPRVKPCFFHLPGTSKIVLYGGIANSFTYTDMWQFDLDTLKWTIMKPEGVLPTIANPYCVYAASEEKVFFYGGERLVRGQSLKTQSGLWSYDLKTNFWKSMKTNGQKLPALAGHVMVWHAEKNQLLLHGGCSSWAFDSNFQVTCPKISGDVYQYDIKNNWWSKDLQAEQLPRREHSATLVHNEFFIFGGEEESYRKVDSMAQYEVTFNPLDIQRGADKSSDKSAIIIGALFGTVVAVALAVVVGFLVIRRLKKKERPASTEAALLLQ